MALARELVGLEARIRKRAEVDLFLPASAGSPLAVPECASIVQSIRSTDSASVMRLCLQALRIQYDQLRPRLLDAELVATLPPETPGIARPTERVVREMIEHASSEIILLGYEFTDGDFVTLLADAARRGGSVIVICDRERGAASTIVETWPAGVQLPRILHNRERPDGAPYSSMHAECLLVDMVDLLVTSANFTFHGLHGNVEIGVRLGGAPAGEARKIFSYLAESRTLEDAPC